VLKLFFFIPLFLLAQIEEHVRDTDPSLFRNQRIFHAPPNPLYKGRAHTLEFLTDIPDDSVASATLFFKTDSMLYYQEFSLAGIHGHYQFKYEPKRFPGTRLQYYFVMKAGSNIFGAPLDSLGEIFPMNKLLIDPIQYFKQKVRLNQ
jgi:hypothetical protein